LLQLGVLFTRDGIMATTELVHLHGKSWVIPGPTNIGLIEKNDGVYLIDSGNDKDAGRKINKLLAEKEWNLLGIINTHSNADHIGANDYFQRMTECRIYATRTEKSFIESPQIEASFLWGGFTVDEMKNKFFEAKGSKVTDIIQENTEILDDVHIIGLPGHYFQMAGVVSADRVAYVGDAMFGEQILEKYKIPFIYDVAQYRQTITKIREIEARYYVLSHGKIEEKIKGIADVNSGKVDEVESNILDIVTAKKTFEEILQSLCNKMRINLDIAQYALVGNTVRSFLSYLCNQKKIKYSFIDNKMHWETA